MLVVGAGLLAYHNSFTGPFTFDDGPSIRDNPTIRHLWPIWQCLSPPRRGGLTVEGRPLINLSLAVNYALGGYDVWGYHAFNLAIHILAGLTLLGIVRRTLLQPVLRERFGAVANELAAAAAVIWVVHPLQTESVTYVVQRAESIMGLCYLLTLYCFIRGAELAPTKTGSWGPRTRRWYGLSAAACALGMASKEVMVSAPVMVLLYDRAFVSGTFREAWRRRRSLYLALAGTWILLGFLLAGGQLPATSATAQQLGLTWWQYLATEPGVILHYLQLSVWPRPLCLDYQGWPVAKTWATVLPPALVIALLLGATVWAWKFNSAWGFLGAWFFLILAPSSSVIPLDSPAFEHRMYLPLAALAVAGVVGLYALVGRRTVAVATVLAIGLGILTWRRNLDYRSELVIWEDTVAKRPDDPRAHYNLAVILGKAGRTREEVEHYQQALRLKPNYADAHYNLGVAAWEAGNIQGAIQHWEQALRLNPDLADAHYDMGVVLNRLGKSDEAISHYEQAVRIAPNYAKAHNDLAGILARLGRTQEAVGQYEEALRVRPDFAEAHYRLGVLLAGLGRTPEAIVHLEEAVRLKPDYAEALNNLGVALWRAGRVQEAVRCYERALRSKPDYAEAHYNLGGALEQTGRRQEAIEQYEQALRIKPDFTEAESRLTQLRGGQ